MSISLFEPQSQYQAQLEKMNAFFTNDIQILSVLQRSIEARASLDFDYAKGAMIIVKELNKQANKIVNKKLKNAFIGITSDWTNMAQQKTKLGTEFTYIAQNDVKKMINTYKVSDVYTK